MKKKKDLTAFRTGEINSVENGSEEKDIFESLKLPDFPELDSLTEVIDEFGFNPEDFEDEEFSRFLNEPLPGIDDLFSDPEEKPRRKRGRKP